MYWENKIWVGKSQDENICLYPKMANRHGLIAGATGTGKTVTLRVLAESFSNAGVPVFLADAKGDLSGFCQKGEPTGKVLERLASMELGAYGFQFESYPITYWDVYGKTGLPLRTTISEMGPLLLSRIMNLNATQSDIMTIIFKIADDEGLLLIDTKDLRAMLQYVTENAQDYAIKYGNISKQSVGAISRALTALEADGGDVFFGEPALNVTDWLTTDENGRGMIQALDCRELLLHPLMYSTCLLWMLSELYETLPEVGDPDKPKMVFFFDEAHLLFDQASKILLDKIEQVVKLIRSKGIGIYFITQVPADIPDGVLGQLGNKIQHALRAYTPADQKAVKAAAASYRVNPEFDTYTKLQELATGEALISVLDEEGIPTIVKQATILPPQSMINAVSDDVRDAAMKANPLYDYYINAEDRDSAYEFLTRRNLEIEEQKAQEKAEQEALKQQQKEEAAALKQKEREEAAALRQQQREEAAALKQKEREEAAALRQQQREEAAALKQKEREEAAARKAEEAKEKKFKAEVNKIAGSAAGTVGREIGNTFGKSLGGNFGKRLGGNVGASLGRGLMNTLFKK